jgi:hypothetical protein
MPSFPCFYPIYYFQGMDFFRADSRVTPAPRCIAARPCILNAGCAGVGKGFQPKKPWCAGGVLVGKCDCTACVGGIVRWGHSQITIRINHLLVLQPCNNDSKCGGLIGACNNKTKTCDCLKGPFVLFIYAIGIT